MSDMEKSSAPTDHEYQALVAIGPAEPPQIKGVMAKDMIEARAKLDALYGHTNVSRLSRAAVDDEDQEPPTREFRISKVIDVLLRCVAAVGSIASLPLALIVGIMANDNGTQVTRAITVASLLLYIAWVVFIIWLAIAPRRTWSRVLVYCIGLLSIGIGSYFVYNLLRVG